MMQAWADYLDVLRTGANVVPFRRSARRLAARAASQGRSMQEFLRAALERLAARPTAETWLQQVRRRKRVTQTRIASGQIVRDRDADRR